jgi:acyl carrier protein
MTRGEFVRRVSTLVEQEVDESTLLKDVAAWDSMSAIGFIAMAEAELGVAVRPQDLFDATKVADLCDLVAEKLS